LGSDPVKVASTAISAGGGDTGGDDVFFSHPNAVVAIRTITSLRTARQVVVEICLFFFMMCGHDFNLIKVVLILTVLACFSLN